MSEIREVRLCKDGARVDCNTDAVAASVIAVMKADGVEAIAREEAKSTREFVYGIDIQQNREDGIA